MTLSFIYSIDSFLKTVARLSFDIRTSVAKWSHCKFAKKSRRQVRDMIKPLRLARDYFPTHENSRGTRATLARVPCESSETNFAKQSRRAIHVRGVARKCVMLKPNTFFQLKLLVFHNFFSERPGEIPYLKKSR